MTNEPRVEDFISTSKQKAFEHDFLKRSEQYQRWEDVEFNKVWENERRFTIEAEDIRFYSEGVMDDNPLFNDEQVAKSGPFGGLTAHPMFITPITFWLAGESGPSSWVRTPGAINPGQIMEIYEPFRVGDTIRSRAEVHDKWIKRGKRYLTFQVDYLNQDDLMIFRVWTTLILPRSQGEGAHQF